MLPTVALSWKVRRRDKGQADSVAQNIVERNTISESAVGLREELLVVVSMFCIQSMFAYSGMR